MNIIMGIFSTIVSFIKSLGGIFQIGKGNVTNKGDGKAAGRDINEGDTHYHQLIAKPDPNQLIDKFNEVKKLMPKLIKEMEQDVLSEGNELTREFWATPKGACFSPVKPVFFYYKEEHDNLYAQMDMLNERGFINRLGGHAMTPRYRMTEDFVKLLRVEIKEQPKDTAPRFVKLPPGKLVSRTSRLWMH